jgi:RNA polymerase sigma factor (TIGR02999 family)
MGKHRVRAAVQIEDGSPPEDRRTLDLLYSATYEELRRLASSVRRNSPGLSISPTTLVHKAWVKLAATPGVAATSCVHFKRIAARAMRQVLVEAARWKHAEKRGGRDVAFVTLDDSIASDSTPEQFLALDAALHELARVSPREAQMVEYRFFGGLELAEIAEELKVSEATVFRDLRTARARLANLLAEAS